MSYLNAVNALVNTARVAYTSALAAGAKSDPASAAYARLPPLTFSFGRGLQGDAMRRWAQGDEAGACTAFRSRAQVCSVAAKGSKNIAENVS